MSLRNPSPCLKAGNHCDKRHVGCHISCEEYIAWKEDRCKELEKKKKYDDLRHQLDSTAVQRAIKMKNGRKLR